MWNVLREFFRRAPLLALILLVWLILTIASFAGRKGPYRDYSTDHGRLPGLSLVMQGLHDHRMPWSAASEKERDEDISAEGEEKKADPEGGSGSAVDSEGGEEKAANPEGGSGSAAKSEDGKESGAAQAQGGEEAAAKTEAGVLDGGITGGSKGGKAQGAEESGENQPAAEEQKTAAAGSDSDPEKKADSKKADTQKADAQQQDTGEIPASSGSRVVSAKNYGVANDRYLSPEDTVYNTDREGLFAPNGIYYPLEEVEDSYFSDALFVGDSRTVGLYEYGNMESVASFLARESTTVYGLFNDDELMDYSPKGKDTIQQRTLKDLLSKARFKKIYLSVGVNELGIPDTEDFYEEYRKVIKKIHKLQPGAIIYIQGIMHVSKTKSSWDPIFNNTVIVQRNRAISTLANGRSIFYIDMNSVVCDKDGNLLDDLTGDGIHLKASACELWHSFLKKNAAVVPD